MRDKVKGRGMNSGRTHRLHLPQAANPAVDPKALFHQTKGNGGALARVRLRT